MSLTLRIGQSQLIWRRQQKQKQQQMNSACGAGVCRQAAKIYCVVPTASAVHQTSAASNDVSLIPMPNALVRTSQHQTSCTENYIVTLRASEAAAQCIVIGPVCLFVCVCLWVCRDNSKLRASILIKLCL